MTQASRARRLVRRVSRDMTRPPGSGGRYGLLLLVLTATYLVSAFSGGRVTAGVQVGLVAAILVLALRTSPLPGRWPALIGVVTMAGSVSAVLGAALTGTQAGTGAADLWKALMLLLTAVLIVRRVLARRAVTTQSIYGALSAYLVIGLMFAACYAAIQQLGRGLRFSLAGSPPLPRHSSTSPAWHPERHQEDQSHDATGKHQTAPAPAACLPPPCRWIVARAAPCRGVRRA